jgi:hypothetical protein
MVIPPWSQACTHQSQPLHLFSSIISKPVSSACESARSGHAFTHFASSHPLQDNAKLSTGAMRTTLILERIGFQVFSPFSTVQAYSQIPHPMHLPGSTEMNFLCWVLADIVTKPFLMLNYHCASFAFNRYLKKKSNPWKNKFTKQFIAHFSEESSHLYKKKINKQVPAEKTILSDPQGPGLSECGSYLSPLHLLRASRRKHPLCTIVRQAI